MPTYYKPTLRRGKRVVYRSTDPAEPKKEAISLAVFIGIVLMAALVWLSLK